MPNRYTLPESVPDEVGDPANLVAMAAVSNEFNNRVRDRMPKRHDLVQLSQEHCVDFRVVFAQEHSKARVEELALTDMDGAFPSLPPSAMETATSTAVVDDPAPTTFPAR